MARLDDLDAIERYDRAEMLDIIGSFPEQCRRALKIGTSVSLPRAFRKQYDIVVSTGLGGSAIGADIMRAYILGSSPTPLVVNRGYELPGFVSKKSLVIASSYSGDTEETISSYKDARRRGAKIIAITSGGRLRKLAEADGFPVIIIPGGLPPRCALGYSSITLLMTLAKIGLIGSQRRHIEEAVAVMDRLRKEKLGPGVPQRRNIAKRVASELYGKFPVIYGAQDRIDAVVTRWRGQIAENAKTLASSHFFPEMNHNEIVGWGNPAKLLKNFAVVVLRDAGDHPRVARRIDITEELIEKRCAGVTEVTSCGKGLLARIFSLIYIGDYMSFYLAILNGCDPTPVESITFLKKELGR